MNQDYLVSNETSYQHISYILPAHARSHEVYIGVGSDQNFTYAAAANPSYTFIIDHRPENQLLHYLFKACFELAPTRADYLSILFSKPVEMEPSGWGIPDLVAHFTHVKENKTLFLENSARIRTCIRRYRKSLPDAALDTIQDMHACFSRYHLDLKTRFDLDAWYGMKYPDYRDLLLATDREGRRWHFLDQEERYLVIRNMQARHRVVAITGDFTGEKTLRELAAFIRNKRKTVSVLYVSNVEESLFQENRFEDYAANLRLLPVDKQSLIIRSVVNHPDRPHPAALPGYMFTTVAQSVEQFLILYSKGYYKTYRDVATLDYIAG